jgi:methylthioxylose transferase
MIAPLSGSNPEQPEYGWIALCPWLIVAATAPRTGARAAGKPGEHRMRSVRVPLVTAGAGACAAIVLMYSG